MGWSEGWIVWTIRTELYCDILYILLQLFNDTFDAASKMAWRAQILLPVSRSWAYHYGLRHIFSVPWRGQIHREIKTMSFFDLSIKIKINVPANVQWKRKSERTIENKRMRVEIIGTEPAIFLLFPSNIL